MAEPPEGDPREAGREGMMRAEWVEIMSLYEASDYLRIKRRTMYELVLRGAVPGKKIGGQWRFRRSHLDRLLDEPVTAGAQPGQAQGAQVGR